MATEVPHPLLLTRGDNTLSMMTPKKFSIHIEDLVRLSGMTYMEAVLYYCEENEIDPSTVKSLISKGLKEKIEADARRLNFLPRVSELPV